MLLLIKTFANVKFGISYLKYTIKNDGAKRLKLILFSILITFCVIYMVGIYTFVMFLLYKASAVYNLQKLTVAAGFLTAQLFTLFVGFFTLYGEFYYTKDGEFLASLPIKSSKILISRFIMVMITELVTSVPFIFPPAIMYGVDFAKGPLYYLLMVLLTVVAPIIPLAIASLLLVPIMRFVGKSRHKEKLAVAGGFILFGGIMFINMFFSTKMSSIDMNKIADLLFDPNGILHLLTSRFPPALWATYAITSPFLESLINFLMFFGVSVLSAILIYFICSKTYARTIAEEGSVRRSGKGGLAKTGDKAYRQKPLVLAYCIKEWRLLSRTPIYALNSLFGIILGPIMIPLSIMPMKNSSNLINSLFSDKSIIPFITLILVAYTGFISSTNMASPTTISREGSLYWTVRSSPVPYPTIIKGKFLCNYLICVASIATTVAATGFFLGELPVTSLIAAFLLSCIMAVGITSSGICIDLIRPKLSWNNPQEAMKQNVNAVIWMFTNILIIGILAFFIFLFTLLNIRGYLLYLPAAFVITVISMIFYMLMINLSKIRMQKFE